MRNKDVFCEKVSRVSFIYDWLEFICILNLSIYHILIGVYYSFHSVNTFLLVCFLFLGGEVERSFFTQKKTHIDVRLLFICILF